MNTIKVGDVFTHASDFHKIRYEVVQNFPEDNYVVVKWYFESAINRANVAKFDLLNSRGFKKINNLKSHLPDFL